MPRINVEDDFWTHPRYRALVRLIGDEDKAAGMCLRLWRLAQRYWAKRENVPFEVWDLECLEPLVTVGLAERRDDGVYCRGAEKHFEWYSQKVEAGRRGGKKSASSRAQKYGTTQPISSKHSRSTASKRAEALPKHPRSDTPEATNPLTLYMQEKPAFEYDSEDLESNKPKTSIFDPKRDLDTKDRSGSDVWDAYSGAYLARYRVPPVRNAKVNAMCAQLVKRLGGDAAIAVVRFYLTHNSAYYVQKAHGLGPCLADAEGLHTQWKNNTAITQASASHADKNSANHQAFKNVAARWAERKKGEADGKGD